MASSTCGSLMAPMPGSPATRARSAGTSTHGMLAPVPAPPASLHSSVPSPERKFSSMHRYPPRRCLAPAFDFAPRPSYCMCLFGITCADGPFACCDGGVPCIAPCAVLPPQLCSAQVGRPQADNRRSTGLPLWQRVGPQVPPRHCCSTPPTVSTPVNTLIVRISSLLFLSPLASNVHSSSIRVQ